MLIDLIAKSMKAAVKRVGRSRVRGSDQFKHRPLKLKQYDLREYRKVSCPGGEMIVRVETFHAWREPTGVFKELRDRRKRRARRVRAAERAKERAA